MRQAIAYAINKKEVAKAVYWGLGETLNNQAFESALVFTFLLRIGKWTLAKAKQLLAEAGYPKGFKTEFLVTP